MVLSPLWHIDAEKNNEGCFGAPRLIFSPGRRETSIPSPVNIDFAGFVGGGFGGGFPSVETLFTSTVAEGVL
jgi:hypothetical protein